MAHAERASLLGRVGVGERTRADSGVASPLVCPACTFVNTVGRRDCEICGAALTPVTVASSSSPFNSTLSGRTLPWPSSSDASSLYRTLDQHTAFAVDMGTIGATTAPVPRDSTGTMPRDSTGTMPELVPGLGADIPDMPILVPTSLQSDGSPPLEQSWARVDHPGTEWGVGDNMAWLDGAVAKVRLSRWHGDGAAAGRDDRPAAVAAAGAGDGRVPLFPQMMAQLYGIVQAGQLRQPSRPWRVDFAGEGGTDAGGPFAEALTNAIEDAVGGAVGVHALVDGGVTHHPLFIPSPNGREGVGVDRDALVPNPVLMAVHQSPAVVAQAAHKYVFLGRLIGVAVRLSFPIPMSLARVVWRLLVAEVDSLPGADTDGCSTGPPAWLVSLDLPLAKMVSRAIQADVPSSSATGPSASCEALSGLTLSIPSADGTAIIDLVPGGRQQPVTAATAQKFVRLAIRTRAAEFAPAAACLAHGLGSVVPLAYLRLFTPRQLELLVCGQPGLDLPLLKSRSRYEGFGPDAASHPAVQAFWSALASMTPAEQEGVLMFAYARRRLPSGDAKWPRDFTLARMGRDRPDESLPAGHTCSFQLDLPSYSSAEVAKRQLLRAVMEGGVGYDLDGGAAGVVG